ncbi:MAG TPA: hypothetical protein VGS97_13275 [Actinocrinis sp.]|nr:hypothetical protein [Actinocrinis sp.]
MENVIHAFWAPGTRSLVQRIRSDAVDPVIRIDIDSNLTSNSISPATPGRAAEIAQQ